MKLLFLLLLSALIGASLARLTGDVGAQCPANGFPANPRAGGARKPRVFLGGMAQATISSAGLIPQVDLTAAWTRFAQEVKEFVSTKATNARSNGDLAVFMTGEWYFRKYKKADPTAAYSVHDIKILGDRLKKLSLTYKNLLLIASAYYAESTNHVESKQVPHKRVWVRGTKAKETTSTVQKGYVLTYYCQNGVCVRHHKVETANGKLGGNEEVHLQNHEAADQSIVTQHRDGIESDHCPIPAPAHFIQPMSHFFYLNTNQYKNEDNAPLLVAVDTCGETGHSLGARMQWDTLQPQINRLADIYIVNSAGSSVRALSIRGLEDDNPMLKPGGLILHLDTNEFTTLSARRACPVNGNPGRLNPKAVLGAQTSGTNPRYHFYSQSFALVDLAPCEGNAGGNAPANPQAPTRVPPPVLARRGSIPLPARVPPPVPARRGSLPPPRR